MSKVYCIIVTFNGGHWIDKCLSSLLKSTVVPHIVIVDNASQDNTLQIIKSTYPNTELIVNRENLGFGRANNIGIEMAVRAKADYVFLINQDAFVEPNCLFNLIKLAKNNKEYALLSPFHLNYCGSGIEEYFNNEIIAAGAPGLINDLYFKCVKKLYTVPFVHAAAWLMPIVTIKEVGGFDPLFFHYGEDNEYVQRVKYYGKKIGIVPDAIMYHKGTNGSVINGQQTALFKRNIATINLKNPVASYFGALVVFLKSIADGVGSAILFRDGKRIKSELALFVSILKDARRIKRSRRIQKKPFAYLEM